MKQRAMYKKILTTSLAAIAAVVVSAGERTLTLDEYRDKMKGAWVGQMVGVSWGQPTEFKWKDEIIPAGKVPEWASDFPLRMAYGNDDLYVEMTFLDTLEKNGLSVSQRRAGLDFANSGYRLWHANAEGRNALRRGIAPPDSGHPQFNSCANDIDYQIEADFSGLKVIKEFSATFPDDADEYKKELTGLAARAKAAAAARKASAGNAEAKKREVRNASHGA